MNISRFVSCLELLLEYYFRILFLHIINFCDFLCICLPVLSSNIHNFLAVTLWSFVDCPNWSLSCHIIDTFVSAVVTGEQGPADFI